jgi:hypothetical protein
MEVFREKDGLTFEEVDPVTDEPCHTYRLNGERLISLTQILSAAGMISFEGIAEDVLRAKARFGTAVHDLCLFADKGDLDLEDLKPFPKHEARVMGWLDFVKDYEFEPDIEWCEVPMAVRVNGCVYAMKLDRFGMTSYGHAVIEIKTSCDLAAAYDLQTAAQALPFRSERRPVVKRFIVQLLDRPNPAGKYYYVKECTNRMDEKVFLSALTVTQWRINNRQFKERN